MLKSVGVCVRRCGDGRVLAQAGRALVVADVAHVEAGVQAGRGLAFAAANSSTPTQLHAWRPSLDLKTFRQQGVDKKILEMARLHCVFPDFYPQFLPSIPLQLEFEGHPPGQGVVHYGNTIAPNGGMGTQPPRLVPPRSSRGTAHDSAYALLMASAEDEFCGVQLHWLVTNINESFVIGADALVPYSGPTPDHGSRRFVFLLLAQNAKDKVTPPTNIENVCLPDFIRHNKLKPRGISFFRTGEHPLLSLVHRRGKISLENTLRHVEKEEASKHPVEKRLPQTYTYPTVA
eukprot:CAMPEP_0177641930 /NCGR_PEP_ID=MMETSP0447-20121125/7323_1 /TAXON_ID=0 /ORGANISM="Stygamoeba regulata, Strain BSH-02190019" /LENGTH=288 /DNA_ID=CAMNT_0019144069 /DNA_START=54 /DNA_END=920 /DNA_ORIENTATION=-